MSTNKAPKVAKVERRWVGIPDAAVYSGYHERTIRQMVSNGTLPAYRIDNRSDYRIDLADLDALLKPV